ncbi:DinB family protein [Larkinella sp. C7]|uniref:DinB family protein n=1 Tax=Larkinella sp. C7 TaxID=2576607 RepID=UPI0011111FCD|nr:DinB family protein [Larkinella sp. C7]
MIQTLQSLFTRDLHRLKREIELYQDEANLWITDRAITNPAGNLCLHLVGNLNTYIGAVLGHTGYIRHRELEFSLRDIPRIELLQKVDETIQVVLDALDQMREEQLQEEYPLLVFDEKTSTEYFLVHLTTHLTYHLGQINYHRRLLDAEAE